MKVVGCVGNAPTRSEGLLLYRQHALFTRLTTRCSFARQPQKRAGQPTDHGRPRSLRGVPTPGLPERFCGWAQRLMKVVDRRGFAPRSPVCKTGDLLTDRAAHKNLKWHQSRGRESSGRDSLPKAARRAGAERQAIEPARVRLMRTPPSHLAPPHCENGTAFRCCPELAEIWILRCARWRPPYLENWIQTCRRIATVRMSEFAKGGVFHWELRRRTAAANSSSVSAKPGFSPVSAKIFFASSRVTGASVPK